MSTSTKSIPLRLQLARFLIQLWPLERGRLRLTQLLLYRFNQWPNRVSFRFRFGCFVDAPLTPWPWGYRELYLYGIVDANEVAMWRRVLRQGTVVVDGGANWGYWSLVGSKFVGKTGRVYAFEPVPNTNESLKKNLWASQANNVIVYQQALAEQQGSGWINLAVNDPIKSQSSFGTPSDRQVMERVECELVTLDQVLQSKPLRLIKLDIEGAELAALKGCVNILRRSEKPIITFEWNHMTAVALGYQPEDTQKFLEGFGYQLFLATKDGLVTFHDRADSPGWTPMVWALTEEHVRELGA